VSENGKRGKRIEAPCTLDEIPALSQEAVSKRFGVSFQAVQQAERKALQKIRRAIEREARQAGCTPMEWLLGDE
jgi:DNA-directed RNA polymerase sigma subunit (sigma70/sigma32)